MLFYTSLHGRAFKMQVPTIVIYKLYDVVVLHKHRFNDAMCYDNESSTKLLHQKGHTTTTCMFFTTLMSKVLIIWHRGKHIILQYPNLIALCQRQ